MKSYLKKWVGGAAIAVGGGLLSTAALASPLSVQYSDTGTGAYWGGQDETNGQADVVGGPTFEIFGADASRTGDSLTVTIYSNYFYDYQYAPSRLLSTDMGALFIGYEGNLDLSSAPGGPNSGADHWVNDTYLAGGSSPGDADRFSYAFDFGTGANAPNTSVVGDNGAGNLYTVSGPGDVVGTSYAGSPNNRNLQAFDVNQNARPVVPVTGTWALGQVTADNPAPYGNQVGTLTYTITNFFTYALPPANLIDTALVLAWTMTCGNDVMLLVTDIPGRVGETPIPAGLVLLMTGLVGLAGLGRVRSRQVRAA